MDLEYTDKPPVWTHRCTTGLHTNKCSSNVWLTCVNPVIKWGLLLIRSLGKSYWPYWASGGVERSAKSGVDPVSQRLQSEDEDAESIAEKLDIFPPSRSGYTQKVRTAELLLHVRQRLCHRARFRQQTCAGTGCHWSLMAALGSKISRMAACNSLQLPTHMCNLA